MEEKRGEINVSSFHHCHMLLMIDTRSSTLSDSYIPFSLHIVVQSVNVQCMYRIASCYPPPPFATYFQEEMGGGGVTVRTCVKPRSSSHCAHYCACTSLQHTNKINNKCVDLQRIVQEQALSTVNRDPQTEALLPW